MNNDEWLKCLQEIKALIKRKHRLLETLAKIESRIIILKQKANEEL